MIEKYDLVILGGGPGGYVAAIRASQLGMKVAVVEKEAIGGTCLHHGCIPSKAIIRSAEVLSLIQRSESFGIKVGEIQADFGAAVDRSQKVLDKLHRGIKHVMKKAHIQIIPGRGELIAIDQIEVTSTEGKSVIQGKHIIIASGSRVQSLPNLPIDGSRIITSDDALTRKTLPKSIVIVGGGAIGVEFAYIYAVYGVKVTIVEAAPRLLPMEDPEVSALLARSFKKRKISVLSGQVISSFEDRNDCFDIELKKPDGETSRVSAEVILVAVGRAPNVEKIGLETLGIDCESTLKTIKVNEQMQTSRDSIYAIGDVTNRPALAHGAMAQGVYVVESLAGITRPPLTMNAVPSAVYCHPQIASVGLKEQEAREAGYQVKVAKFPFSANGKAIALGETEGFVKIVTNATQGEILGAHLIGAEATELIGEFVLALNLEATASELKQAIHPHPTLSEAVMEAGGAILGEAIHF